MARVVLAMSGGVDSSVAASLLVEQGHHVVGLFMRHGEQAGQTPCAAGSNSAGGLPALPLLNSRANHKQGCCSASDALDARRVADRLDIPFYALDFSSEFGRIKDYFADEYTAGRTPNPCVMCNNWLKFGKLLDYADGIGAELVATGHYARLLPATHGGAPELHRGLDAGKDQSYVLFGIQRAVLDRVRFPIGGFRKEEIRQRARQLGLRVADKPDSQEICFVPDGDYASFVRRHRPEAEDLAGEIVTTAGQVVGRHPGLEHFTIGQRKGLGVALGEPRYVVRLERDTRRVVIGTRDELACRTVSATGANWLIEPPAEPLECEVQIRYACQPAPGRLIPTGADTFQVELAEARTGIAPGQAVVCYRGSQVLGGGWIT